MSGSHRPQDDIKVDRDLLWLGHLIGESKPYGTKQCVPVRPEMSSFASSARSISRPLDWMLCIHAWRSSMNCSLGLGSSFELPSILMFF
jgi:hypothetical protein